VDGRFADLADLASPRERPDNVGEWEPRGNEAANGTAPVTDPDCLVMRCTAHAANGSIEQQVHRRTGPRAESRDPLVTCGWEPGADAGLIPTSIMAKKPELSPLAGKPDQPPPGHALVCRWPPVSEPDARKPVLSTCAEPLSPLVVCEGLPRCSCCGWRICTGRRTIYSSH
jgi:hypothetical protein